MPNITLSMDVDTRLSTAELSRVLGEVLATYAGATNVRLVGAPELAPAEDVEAAGLDSTGRTGGPYFEHEMVWVRAAMERADECGCGDWRDHLTGYAAELLGFSR